MVEARVGGAVAAVLQHGGHRHPQEGRLVDRVAPVRRPADLEQALARPHQQVGHLGSSHPPDRACITWISSSSPAGSDIPARSAICSPFRNTVMCLRSVPCSSSTYDRTAGRSSKYARSASPTVLPATAAGGASTWRCIAFVNVTDGTRTH